MQKENSNNKKYKCKDKINLMASAVILRAQTTDLTSQRRSMWVAQDQGISAAQHSRLYVQFSTFSHQILENLSVLSAASNEIKICELLSLKMLQAWFKDSLEELRLLSKTRFSNGKLKSTLFALRYFNI